MKAKIEIIAEIGVNHNGCLNTALNLVEKSKWAGADIVKFQTFVPEDVVISNLKLAPYQKKNLSKKKQQTMLSMIRKYFLNFTEQKKLYNYFFSNNCSKLLVINFKHSLVEKE